MPLNTRVGRCVTRLKKKYGYGPAIGICQKSTKQHYMTGKSMRMRTRKRRRRRRRRRRRQLGGASCIACLYGHSNVLKDMLEQNGYWSNKQTEGLSDDELRDGRIKVFNDFYKICEEDNKGCATDTSIKKMSDVYKIQLMQRLFSGKTSGQQGGFLSDFWGTWNKEPKKGLIPGSWSSDGMDCNPYLWGQCPGGGVCKPSGFGIGNISFGGKCHPRGGGGKKSKRRYKRNRRKKNTKCYTIKKSVTF